MIIPIIFAALAALQALPTLADPGPLEPSPGSVYNTGSPCLIKWNADTTGVWTQMVVELKSGSDLNQIDVTYVATVDGTDPNNASYSWTCPEVTPYSAIYFYEFTSPASSAAYWTTRFAIADSTGATTPPPNLTQPDGNISWGNGALTDPSQVVLPPTDLSSSGSNSSTTPGTVSTSPMAGNTTLNGTISSNGSSTSSSQNGTSSSSSANSTGSSTSLGSANANGALRNFFTPALSALTFIALTFTLFF